MNIRIGNDVRVELSIRQLGNIDPANVKSARCIFIAKSQTTENPNCHIFNCSNQYTIHNCNNLSYNVLPHNCCKDHCQADSHDCGFVYNKLFNHVAMCQLLEDRIVAIFPGEFLTILGNYDCLFEVNVFQEGWDFDNIRMYTAYKFNAFTLVTDWNPSDNGHIQINPSNNKKDTYILSASDEELIACRGDYSTIIQNKLGFTMPLDKEELCTVDVDGSGKRIIIFSKYNNLKLKYGIFDSMCDVYVTLTGLYMYVTPNTYSNQQMEWILYLADLQNQISGQDPYVDGNIDDPSEQPETTNNWLIGDTIVLQSELINEQLNNFGTINEQTTIVL